jgi:hypothetical protein
MSSLYIRYLFGLRSKTDRTTIEEVSNKYRRNDECLILKKLYSVGWFSRDSFTIEKILLLQLTLRTRLTTKVEISTTNCANRNSTYTHFEIRVRFFFVIS